MQTLAQTQNIKDIKATPKRGPAEPDCNVDIYTHTNDVWEAMLEDCKNAQHSIVLEQYILQNDETGRKFLSLFAEKASQGVRVRLLLDKFGSNNVYNIPLIKEIRRCNGSVEFYNDINWLHIFMPWRWLPRSHLKLLLIDSGIAYIGGACIAQHMKDWDDIVARISGAQVQIFGKNDFEHINHSPDSQIDGLCYKISHPDFPTAESYDTLITRIKNAKNTIKLVTPYFSPPKRLKDALKQAARRDVRVDIVISEKTDVPIAGIVSRSFFPELIQSGVNIYSYNHGVCHAKYGIIDDTWAILGSTNLDYLSLLYNREGNLLITNKDVIESMDTIFEETKSATQQMGMDAWSALPLKTKIIGFAGRLFKKIM